MASTVVSTLYPPLIETFQPAFIYTDKAIITFSISPFNEISKIKSVHVSVVDQRNNANVLIGNLTPTSQIVGNDDVESDLYYGITNGILIAEFPEFQDNPDTQTIGLFQYDPTHNLYAIHISPDWLNRSNNTNNSKGYWNNNQYYQVQIRFDSCTDIAWHDDASEFGTYMLTQRPYFSEWSSITLIKPILKPELVITQLNNNKETSVYPGNFHISGNLTFTNSLGDKNGISDETELLQSYKIIVQYHKDDTVIEISNSDWIYAAHNILGDNNNIDYLLDFTNIPEQKRLNVIIYYKTNNGYIGSKLYTLLMANYSSILDKDEIKWNNKSDLDVNDIDVNQEDGIAQIRFTTLFAPIKDEETGAPTGARLHPDYGIVYFRRACSKNNFKTWDLVYQYIYTGEDNRLNINFDDFTIASLYRYKYSVQMCTIAGNTGKETWGKIYFSNECYPKFYEMLLMRQNRQIAVRYNGQVSSWKPTVNRQKIDTLGSKYPKFVENATMNYKIYSIAGLICAEEDFNRKFLHEFDSYSEYDIEEDEIISKYTYQNDMKTYDTEFNTKYILRNDSAADGENLYPNLNQIHGLTPSGAIITGTDLYKNGETFTGQLFEEHDSYPQDHWYWEREFREELVNWLNDGEPKLYRSMPEGNIAVMLTDINLTPNEQLGRRLYNFNATMYEIADGYNLDDLKNLGIIDMPETESVFLSTLNFANQISDTNMLLNAGQLITKIGQMQISGTGTSGWVNNNVNSIDIDTSNYWDSLPLRDKFEKYYTGNNKNWKILSNSILLNNLSLQFTSSPHYYKLQNNKFIRSIEEINGQQVEVESDWLGYVIEVDEYNSDNNGSKQIFINQKGYYQIPKNIKLSNIKFDSNQQVTLNYIYEYRRKGATDSIPDEPEKIKTIIGQYTDDNLPLNTNIMPLIYKKYEKKNYKKGMLINRIYLALCYGILIDVIPYTYIRYKNYNENDWQSLVIGETGVFNGFQDWNITALEILGRRMVVLNPTDTLQSENPISYPFHIEEWQCYRDITGDKNHPKINGIYEVDNEHNEQIYYIDGQWYPIDKELSTSTVKIAKVPIYGMINYHGDLVKAVYQNA